MTRIVQEKFEVHAALEPDGPEGWVSDSSVRDRQGLQTRGAKGHFEPYTGDFYNSLPPGSKVESQEVFCKHSQEMGGGLGSGTQVTEDVNATSLRIGFDRKPLSPTDDMYTREHNDAFYDDVGGFVERNNMLDRL